MFDFFKKNERSVQIKDIIFMTEAAKFQALFEKWQGNKNMNFIFWFEESLELASTYFHNLSGETVNFLRAREVTTTQITVSHLAFGEHYPLRTTEEALFKKLNLKNVLVYSALSEPLFKQYGADKIITLLQKTGLKENESLEHKMISTSIRKAQKKLEMKILIENRAYSQTDWFKKNIPA